jgi:hypothetical protein
MYYKFRGFIYCLLACAFVFTIKNLQAQGIVSLSEEAMFDDELETTKDFSVDENKPLPTENASESLQDKTSESEIAKQNEQPKVVVAEQKETVLDSPEYNDPLLTIGDTNDTAKKEDVLSIKKNNVDDLFEQMSDIEKTTTLLNLELRREKLQNEIEAVKSQRRKAIEEEKAQKEEARLNSLKKEQELQNKKLEEERRLRIVDIQFEELRQEKILRDYKNKMLEENQKWIDKEASLYKIIENLRGEKKVLADKHKADLLSIEKESQKSLQAYQNKMLERDNKEESLKSQISILRNRIASMEKEYERRKSIEGNPFAQGEGASTGAEGETSEKASSEPNNEGLAKLYAVTEVRGQGGELIAKLINKSGLSFYVKKGTTLQTGHTISEIMPTYVAAEKGYKKDYIYFSAGGILPEETEVFQVDQVKSKGKK